MMGKLHIGTAALLGAALCGWAASISGTVRAAAGAGATGAPIEGAKVVLIQFAGGGGGGTQTRLDSSVTDAEGKYAFAEADTGTRLIQAIKEGYQNGQGFVNVADDTGAYTVNISLQPPPDTTPGMVKGTVRRVNSQGTPIAGATVVISRSGGGGSAFTPDTTETDAQGNYAFESVPPANYTVRASADGYQNGSANAQVRAKDTATANINLLPEGASGSIAGKVAKADGGAAVAGALVIASRGGGGGGGGTAFTPDTVETDAQGAYSFDSLPVAQGYTLTVKAEGFQSAVIGNQSVAFEQERTADFYLVAAAAGDTTNGSVAGTVVDSARKALAGVRVILSRGGGGGGGGGSTPIDTVETDAQGRYVFGSVAAQTGYRISVSSSGYQNSTSGSVSVAVGQTSISNFTLMPASALRPGAAPRMGARLHADAAGRLYLEMPASGLPARVRLYDARGALGFAGSLPAGATRLDIPWIRGRAGYVVVERGGDIDRLPAPATR